MIKKLRISLFVLLVGLLLVAIILLLNGNNFQLLNPKGIIALKERNLLIFASALSLIIVIPVFFLTFWIAWRYREGNTKATYTPNWDGDRRYEAVWWAIPMVLIAILAVITWQSSHDLDPFKPLASDVKPITIQVVALDWKWLFIYPDQHIATVNYVQIPTDVPINFEVTSDAPMNSFWIPQLGGQIYAMSGMSTHINLMASEPGAYRGSSANISGRGFEGMRFTAQASSTQDFYSWAEKVKQSQTSLSGEAYKQLAKPSENSPVISYASYEDDLYNKIIMKYMMPVGDSHGLSAVSAMHGMDTDIEGQN